jgi:hypothetical protein
LGERVGETPRTIEDRNMMKLEVSAIRTCLLRARLLGLVVSMAACDPSAYTREPLTGSTTGSTGGGASAAVGGGGAFQVEGGASGGAPVAALAGSGGSQGGPAPSGVAGSPGTAGVSAAFATGTGGANGGQETGGAPGALDAAPVGGGDDGGIGAVVVLGGAGQGAGTGVAGLGGGSPAGRGGSPQSASGGSAAGGFGSSGSGGRDAAEYGFETSVAAWQASSQSGSVVTLARDTRRAFAGAASLEAVVTSSSADLVWVVVQNPNVAPGSRVTFHVFVPTGAPIDWVQPYLQEGALSTPPFAWTYAYLKAPELVFGAWNTVTVAFASSATAPALMGVQFHVTAPWSGSVFVDSIGW